MMKEHYPSHDLTVICKPGHEGLYTDFATKVVPHEVDGITRVDCNLAWREGVQIRRTDYRSLCHDALGKPVSKSEILTPLDLQHTWHGGQPPTLGKRSIYVKYGEGKPNTDMIAIHARACNDKQLNRNWSPDNWEQLLADLDAHDRRFAFVGTDKGALYVDHPHAEDMRGVPIGELVNILSSCGQIIGGSSGPMALALLCGTPVTWWSPNAKDVSRFARVWNPFLTPTIKVADTWQPSVDQVVVEARDFL